jgi:hypothetical protein
VNPYDLDPEWNFSRELRGRDPAIAIQEAFDADSLTDFHDDVFPRVELYRQLQSFLAEYRRIAAAGGWPQVPEGPTLRPGDSDERLQALMQRLAVTGDLEEGARIDVSAYGGELEAAVKNFQTRHDLDADGIVGPATLRALNVPVEQRIDQIRVNLERARWVLDNLDLPQDAGISFRDEVRRVQPDLDGTLQHRDERNAAADQTRSKLPGRQELRGQKSQRRRDRSGKYRLVQGNEEQLPVHIRAAPRNQQRTR